MTGDVVDPEPKVPSVAEGRSRGEECPEDEDYSGDEDDDFDCGMCVDGATGELLGCQLAGTEECDWQCPYREDFEAIAREEPKVPREVEGRKR